VAGLAGGVLAISVACADVVSTREARAARIAVLGVLLDLSVLILFAVIALVRLRTDDHVAESGLLLVELLGLAAAGVSTWFGGRLGPRRAPRLRAGRRVAGTAGAGIPRG
jgi:hypothetical protein